MVSLADGVDVDQLGVGDDVLLGAERNVVVGQSPYPTTRVGETAAYDRHTPEGRIVVRWHDEEIIVDVAGSLAEVALNPGDLLRWNRDLFLAYEKLEATDCDELYLEETPTDSFDRVGGLDPQVKLLKRVFCLHQDHPDVVQRYELTAKASVLLLGPPGTGKTLLARALANWLASRHPSGRARFMNIKPSTAVE